VNVQNDPKNKGKKQLIIRLLKFEGTNGIGSAVSTSIQLLLLAILSLSPVLGNIVGGAIGSAVAYAIVYLMSMRFVWKS
jgi:putative flippase GtrA